ncbi:MAG TPA: NAD(P)-binding domain-containing protein [Pyrinomonadaceae bacterium]|jgi:cation diffusion facilitator CzcD-associated flavoprotein CzcO|nr:NAD(P)-binding domain-containing protein [Pyrinomonadaceae bacterium]
MSRTAPAKHVIIIGAGPAGLAASVCLSKRKIPYTLLEQGPLVSAALRKVDPDMVLLSPTELSLMPDMESPPGEPPYLSFARLVEALEHYREQHGVQVITDAKVTDVTRDGEGFTVRYRGKDEALHSLKGTHVINSTGIISHPQLPPDFEPAACTFRWMHSIDVRAPDLRAAPRILVVGGGASAAEVLERWLEVRAPDARAWLSLRSALIAFPHWILGIDIHYFAWLPEQLPTSLIGWRAGRLHEPMTGLAVKRAINDGLITRLPAVKSYRGDTVTISDGEQIRPGLVVFATGFRYATEHLDRLIARDPDGRPLVKNCESTRTRGLYLLGFRFGRTFASPYLRGIARDAEYVAERIASEGE